MWIDTGSGKLPSGVEQELENLKIPREDRMDRVWVNLETGAAVILICEGGWRNASVSGFKVFHRSPGGIGSLIEITFGILGTNMEPFDATKTGGETYRAVYESLVPKITASLGAQQNFR